MGMKPFTATLIEFGQGIRVGNSDKTVKLYERMIQDETTRLYETILRLYESVIIKLNSHNDHTVIYVFPIILSYPCLSNSESQ